LEVLALLKDKARTVLKIASNQTVDDAICLMTSGKVSALLVTENDQPAGIFSERDVFHTYLRNKSTAFSEIILENVMTRDLMVAESQDTVIAVMGRMIKADITHLPVMEEKRIIGMLTLKDLMQHQIDSLTAEIYQLKDYIADLHEAGQD
jgi:CBS domain-containing protein